MSRLLHLLLGAIGTISCPRRLHLCSLCVPWIIPTDLRCTQAMPKKSVKKPLW